jgi:RND family efflux transporter MFP subunit
MKFIRQIFVSALVLAGALYLWITYVPESRPWLERSGVLDLLGIELPEAEAQSGAQGGWGGRGGPTQVITAPVTREVLADRVTAIGDGRAVRAVTVRAGAVGLVTELNLAAGTYVEAGTVLARLESDAEQIALEQAQIQLEDARNAADRVQRLETSGAVSEVRLTETQVAVRSAELAVRQAELDFADRRIEAPISGWVGIIDIEEGDRVNAQDVIATITDRSEILVDFRVPERLVGVIRDGTEIDVTPLALRGVTLSGEVSALDSVVDRASRTLLVQATVPNADDLLRAGMAFSVTMTFPGEPLLSIAPLAVQWSSDGPFVWAVRDGKAAQVPVAIVQRNADSVLVTADGLTPDDVVVTEGVQTLRPGAEVAPAETEAARAATPAAEDTL